jgi:hypothetical protein
VRRAALLLVLLLGCSPPLRGEPVTAPVTDWSFVREAKDVAFETGEGRRFRRVAAQPVVQDGALHLHVFTFAAGDDAALVELLAGGALRMQAAGRVYDLRAAPLLTVEQIEAVLPAVVRDEMKMEATGLRWEPNPPRYPGTQLRQWFFRLESKPPAS